MNFLSLANKTKTVPPLSAAQVPSRYDWLSLELAEPNLGVPPNFTFFPELTTTITWVLTSNPVGTRGWSAFDASLFPLNSPERPDLETVSEAINELIYTFPAITTFTLNKSASPYYQEFGTSLTPVQLAWKSNKPDGKAITAWYLNISGANASVSQWLTGNYAFSAYDIGFLSGGFNQTFEFYLTAVDWKGNRASRTYALKFVGPTFIGTATTDLITSAVVIDGIWKIEYNDYLKGNYNIPTAGGKRFFIAFPQGATIPTFKFGIYTYIPETLFNINIHSPTTGVLKPYTIKYSDTGYVQDTFLTLQ